MAKNATGSAQRKKVQIEKLQSLDLSANDRKVFVEALIDPPPVSDRLRDTVRRYREVAGV